MPVRDTDTADRTTATTLFGEVAPASEGRRFKGTWFLVPLFIHLTIQAVHAYLDRAPDFDEAIYMDLARSVVRTGKLLTSNYPPKPFLIHPPLFYYLVSLSFALFGPGLEAGRLVSTIMSIGNLGLVFSILRTVRGSRWAAAGTLLVAVNPAFLYYGHSVYMEMTVALWMTAALWAFSRSGVEEGFRWERWTGIFLALACVTKYYAAVLVAVMALVIVTQAERDWSGRMRRLAALLGPVVIAGALWVVWGLAMGGKDFIGAQISWGEPDMSGAIYSWRHATNVLFFRELIGVMTPVWACLAFIGWAVGVGRVWKHRLMLQGRVEGVFVMLPVAYLLFLMSFREKDIKYIVPLIPTLGILIGLAPSIQWAGKAPGWLRGACVVLLAILSSPLLPLYDPITGQRHDNLWVFGIRRDAEYRRYRDAGIQAGHDTLPGQVVACQRKGPIIGYYADRPYLDFWGFSPERARPYLAQAEIVVLDRNTEYLSPQEQATFRDFVVADFRPRQTLPGSGSPILELFQRTEPASPPP